MYQPNPLSEQDLARQQNDENRKIAKAINQPVFEQITFVIHYAAPSKPRSGQFYYADGTTWNPGSGEGLYRYSIGGSWVFVG